MYKVFDSYGQFLAAFPNWRAASEYKIAMGRPDWKIKIQKSTNRQKSAVRFCERMLDVTFKGNIEYFDHCSSFLNKYLDEAKLAYEEEEINYKEACESYYSEFMW